MKRPANLLLAIILLITCSGCLVAVQEDRRGYYGDHDRRDYDDRRDHRDHDRDRYDDRRGYDDRR
ncbi:MAG: hypothetical protein C0402_15645 [Thermodesulfovibrio sp.]|nr:hypothetical protein [Thermodesulfovibrio sp.]